MAGRALLFRRIPWSPECWSPAYLAARLRVWAHQRRHPDEPWLSLPAIRAVAAWLKPEHRVLESGAGRSTLWFARRVASVLSFEHDPAWQARVAEQLLAAGLASRAECRLAQGAAYWEHVAALPDASFDLGLVDGVERHRVAEAMLAKIRPGGWLVIDDAQRYFPTAERLPGALRDYRSDHPADEAWRAFARRVKGLTQQRLSDGVHETLLIQVA